jgi:hypothetical protein
VGEDRDGVYGKENRVTTGNAGCYYSITSTVSFAASAQPHAVAPFVADVSGSKPLAARALAGDTSGCGPRHFNLAGNLFCAIFRPERAQRFHQNFLR